MKTKFLAIVCAIFVACGIASCSSDPQEGLLGHVPADADFAGVFNTEPVLNNADATLSDDGTQITLPDYIREAFPELGRKVAEVNTRLQQAGVDVHSVGVFGSFSQDAVVAIAKLNDPAKAEAFLGDGEHTALSDGYLYITPDSRSKSYMLKAIDGAKKKSFGSLAVASAMDKGNAGCMLVNMANIVQALNDPQLNAFKGQLSGYLRISGNVEGKEAEVEFSYVDEKGKLKTWPASDEKSGSRQEQALARLSKSFTDNMAPVSTEALRYLGADINLVYGLNLGDVNLSEVVDNLVDAGMLGRQEAGAAKMGLSFLNGYKGTLAFGIGYNGTLENALNACAMQKYEALLADGTLAAVMEMQPGKAEGKVKDIAGMIEQFGMPTIPTDHGVAVPVPFGGDDEDPVNVYVSAVNDMLVVSNRPYEGAEDNAVTRNVDLRKSPIIMALAIDNFSAAITTDTKNATSLLTIKAVDTPDKLGVALLKAIAATAAK